MLLKPYNDGMRQEYQKLEQFKNSETEVSLASIYSLSKSKIKIRKLFREIHKTVPDLPFTDFVFSYDEDLLGNKEVCLMISLKISNSVLFLRDFYKFFSFLINRFEYIDFELSKDLKIQIALLPNDQNKRFSQKAFYILSLNPMLKVASEDYDYDEEKKWLGIEMPAELDYLEFVFKTFRNKDLLRHGRQSIV